MTDQKNLMDLVFEGGGVKGIGLGGAYAALEDEGFRPNNVAGTSAGAITAALVASGYTARELKDIVFNMPFTQFKDVGGLARVPFIGGAANAVILPENEKKPKNSVVLPGGQSRASSVRLEAWIGPEASPISTAKAR